MDTLKEFVVKSSANGGVVVEGFSKFNEPSNIIGAFTTPGDMLVWLAGNYGLRIERLFQETTGTPRVSVSLPLVGERAGESIVPKSPDLCEDEGCPHHGTEHVCLNWAEWSGDEYRPRIGPMGNPCFVRMRNGKERPGLLFDVPYRWNWAGREALSSDDVVAYRLV
ncbi:hypothetical protein G6M87_10820 [Rhizobium rhizogenes]|nr:hypothetical protein [Rhizobium rhizogenes]QTG05937.1 hypothetical protein G6M87_10820 [Rhizobium rhizogenes]